MHHLDALPDQRQRAHLLCLETHAAARKAHVSAKRATLAIERLLQCEEGTTESLNTTLAYVPGGLPTTLLEGLDPAAARWMVASSNCQTTTTTTLA